MALDNNTQINYTDRNTIDNWFKTGLKPTQQQFWATWASFWHKSDSLPISSINRLGDLLDGKAETNHTHDIYAKNDATSLTDENVISWQNALGVANLEFDDNAILITSDYARFNLRTGAAQSAFNGCVDQEFGLVLYKPTETGTVNEFPYVVGIDAEGNSAQLPAGDLGKNFANTNLNVTTNRKHTGTASVEFGMPFICSNASVRYSGLADKSSDATFNQFALFDRNGYLAKATQIANAFESGLLNISAEQGLRIGQLLNGGQGSSGAIYVNDVSPPVIQNQYNTDESVILTGANLLLNSLAMSIEILASDKITVVANVPNNQITNNSTSELRFLYNFYQFTTGTYYLKITSGVKSYVVPLDLKVVSVVDNININEIVWEKLYESSITPNSLDGAVGGNFTNVSPIGNSLIPVVSYKSSELFAVGENFYIEMKINLAVRANGGTSYIPSYIGLGYSQNLNSLTPSALVYFEWSWAGSSTWYLGKNNGQLFYDGPSPVEFTVVFIKTGNLFRTIIGNSSVSKTISNNSGYSIFLQFVSRLSETTVQGQITKAFKFN